MFLYIHIPFCESKCKYCRFASTGRLQNLQIAKYVNFINILPLTPILSEITPPPTPPLTGDGSMNFKSIYFGGGTPGVLSLEQLKKILSNYNYDNNTEITLESTPNKITKENLIGWKKLGINRLSIGVQSLNNKTLKEIGRGDKGDIIEALDCIKEIIHPNPPLIIKSPHPNPTLIIKSPHPNPLPKGEGTGKRDILLPLPLGSRGIELCSREGCPGVEEGGEGFGLEGTGINNISIDFIIGLPYTQKGDVKKDIEYILDRYYFITHISVYMLEDYYYPGNWQESSILEEDYLEEYIEVRKYLQKRGFNRYELSNFAKPGFECKHNMAYWDHSEVKAIGLSASGYEKGERYTFSSKFSDFYEKKGIFSEKLTKKDIFMEKVMFGFRTLGLLEEIYFKLNQEKINDFIENNYLFIENKKLKLTDKGILVLDYIIGEII